MLVHGAPGARLLVHIIVLEREGDLAQELVHAEGVAVEDGEEDQSLVTLLRDGPEGGGEVTR